MIKRFFLGCPCVITFASCDPAALQQAMDSVLATTTSTELTTKNVADGLKQALEVGVTEGARKLSVTDGYYKSAYKILLPEEAQKVADKLRNVPGFNGLEANILEKVNRGAEDAAKKAAPIFKEAILQMSFADAWDILMGDKDAATKYLKKATSQKLYAEFNPVIVESLDKFNARTYWSSAVDKYNKIPFIEKANPDLDDHVTSEALEGLFEMVRLKELDIRENTASRTTDLLKRVFAKQDK
jgi:hypothetical protein